MNSLQKTHKRNFLKKITATKSQKLTATNSQKLTSEDEKQLQQANNITHKHNLELLLSIIQAHNIITITLTTIKSPSKTKRKLQVNKQQQQK